jgi:hypothetical protein
MNSLYTQKNRRPDKGQAADANANLANSAGHVQKHHDLTPFSNARVNSNLDRKTLAILGTSSTCVNNLNALQ